MEELPEENLNFITCAVWVPKGAAKSNPEKVEISKEDLARIISETKDNVDELEKAEAEAEAEDAKETDKDENATMEVDAEGKEEGKNDEGENGESTDQGYKRKDDDDVDFDTKYIMDNYEDDEEEENMNKLLHLGRMTIHASSDDDPFITVKDKDDNDSEDENNEILPSDNIIAVGHVEGDAAILEAYVYNAEQGCLYVHHDILLPAAPLCMEWLNYDPTDEQLRPANMVAVGSMSPIIEVWDLDLVDCLEPAYKLGKKGKKKKKIPGVGHKDAVLSLAWNSSYEHVLASGSVDETVILWDIQHGTVAQQIKSFKEKVQALKWHSTEGHSLLTGACDKKVRLFDCNAVESFKSWQLDGEVECILWDNQCGKPYNCLASTDQGTVYRIDCRQESPLWEMKAHEDACTGLQMSSQCPGCLVTGSTDGTAKVWDVSGEKPELVKEFQPRIGVIHSLSSCPDNPFVFCMGGDNKSYNFKVIDIRHAKKVRTTFCERIGLPADEDQEGTGDEMSDEENGPSKARKSFGENSFAAVGGPVVLPEESTYSRPMSTKPKFGKKKGGRIDTKRRKR